MKLGLFATALVIVPMAVLPARVTDKQGSETAGIDSIRTFDPDSCIFKREYERIKADKTDPRVAFQEIPIADAYQIERPNADTSEAPCKTEPDPLAGTTAFFDSSHKFFQAFTHGDSSHYTETVTYFAGSNSHEGVILIFWSYYSTFTPSVWVYRSKGWQDVTAQYLGPLNLAKDDFIVVPQFGHSARILGFTHFGADHDEPTQVELRGWLVWNGQKFVLSKATKQPGWRCPDSARPFFNGLVATVSLEKICH